MECGPDASATKAMIRAAIQAEEGWKGATLSGGWKSTLDDVVVQPSTPDADRDREGIQREQSLWEVNKKSDFQQKEKVMREHANRYNSQNPIKTTPPPLPACCNKIGQHPLERAYRKPTGTCFGGQMAFSRNGRCQDEKMA